MAEDKLDKIIHALGNIEGKFDGISARLELHEKRLDSIEKEVADAGKKVYGIIAVGGVVWTAIVVALERFFH